ncbi:alpha-2B adrenergic receptor [Nothobranchius furzeri]|uniref:Alpha-2B adrenergic receptor n=5 Tax=Nothobranchius TaxID=28779 RepID=A0A1A8A1F7_NOTFU|nr:alpha-2B adrenergic receptor [Nothobranchius furzeri]KAF7216664.1 alpha-2B adrenergic receptor-like [Nothobranchius furzeri]
MAAGPDAPCLSELSGLPHRNLSLISGTRPCNRSTSRPSHYSPQATAAFAIAITFMMLLTIVGNILVIIAVLTSRSLKGAQNLFLVSLAAADILVATLIIPFSLANELQGYWAFSSIWCEIYLALDVLFCTSSIVHLCAIALDRYLSISRPVSYGTKRTPIRIKVAIIIVWLISAVISFPPLLTLDKSDGGEEKCELNSERWYILYSTIGSFFAPCVIMILVYMRIYQIAKQHTRHPPGQKCNSVEGAGVAISEPTVKPSDQVQRKDNLEGPAVTTSPSDSTQSSIKKPAKETTEHHPPQPPPPVPPCDGQELPAVSHTDSLKHPNSGLETQPDNTSSAGSEAELGTDEDGPQTEGSQKNGHKSEDQHLETSENSKNKIPVLNQACRYKNTMTTTSGTKLAPEDISKTQGTPVSRRKAMANREKRFTFVLAVVMGVFVICWFPFFFSYSLKAVCPKTCSIPEPIFTFFFWIGYCNSCLNPVIYTIFNQDFRRAFKRILYRDSKGTFF